MVAFTAESPTFPPISPRIQTACSFKPAHPTARATPLSLELEFGSVPGVACSSCVVRYLSHCKDLDTLASKHSARVPGYGSAFFVVG